MARKKNLKTAPGFDEYLKTSYCERKMTMAEIATEVGCTPATILRHLRRCGIKTRTANDYEATNRQREARKANGHSGKGRTLTEAQRNAISLRNKGRRKRKDYEFGGHEKKRTDGYIKVYAPDHPHCTSEGYVMKHILVMEQFIGRYISPGECVHHINHIRDDNRIENLKLMTISEHMSMHMKERHENRRKRANEP